MEHATETINSSRVETPLFRRHSTVDAITARDFILGFPVREDDIQWSGSEPVPRIEEIDPLGLTDHELLGHVYALIAELRSVRLALVVAVEKIAELDEARLRLSRSYERLRRERRS